MSEPSATPREHGLVRIARPGDFASLRAIEVRAFEPARRSSPRSLRRSLTSPRQRVWVCEADGRVVGFVIAWRFAQTWRVYNLATDPAWQARGIGGRLLATVLDAARVTGVRRVVLESRNVPQLAGWYRKLGFRPIRELPDYYGPGESALRMELTLTETG